MRAIKGFFKSLGNGIKTALWNLNNFIQKCTEAVKNFIKKIWQKITLAEKRREKQNANYKKASAILGLEEGIDIRYDIDLEVEYNKIDEQILELKAQVKENKANADQILVLNNQINELKEFRKILPPTRAQILKKESIVKETKGLGQAFLYLWPAIILLAIFSFYPIFNAFRLVFYEGYNEVTGSITGFTLFGNFIEVLTDSNFIVPAAHTGSSAMINTLLIVILTVPVSIVISLLISVLLNSIKPLQSFFQTVFFLPYVTNSLAVGLVFAYMFKTDGGLFNQFLGIFGVNGGSWVGPGASYGKAMFVLVLFSIWNGLAFKIMVFMSAIQGIDKQYYDAAMIDATPKFKQFRRITVPLISPTILYIVITSVIGAFKTYSSVIAIFGNTGQPPGATYNLKTIVFYIYDFFNTTGKFSQAAAASIILFGLILVLTLVQMQVSKKRVHY